MQIISNDKTVRSKRVQVLKDSTSQSSASQVKKGKKIVAMMPAVENAFNLMADDDNENLQRDF